LSQYEPVKSLSWWFLLDFGFPKIAHDHLPESRVSWRETMKKHNASLTEVRELVQEVLDEKFKKQSYPENITDQVCLAIEENPAWRKRYDHLVESYSKLTVNSQIGRSTLQLTGLKNLGLQASATSSLIKTYTRLG
jgi:hypothetical protein